MNKVDDSAHAPWSCFESLDIRVGTIVKAEHFEAAKKPAYKLWVDFGREIGVKQSSAQITNYYKPEDLVGEQVLGIINLGTKQIANFLSECLVLGVYEKSGVVLIQPQRHCENGDKLG